jgi:hypothetical protein
MVGVSEGPVALSVGLVMPFGPGVQVDGMATKVLVSEGRTMATGMVGGGNGLKPDMGSAKMVITIMPTINKPINIRIDRASHTENFMKPPAFPRDLPKKMLLMSV